MPTFTPPTVNDVPFVFTQDRDNQHPWAYFAPMPRGVNVFKLLDGTYTETQPMTMAEIAVWYHGGHSHTVSTAEAAALSAAGYAAFIT